jgi:hypothetical protein
MGLVDTLGKRKVAVSTEVLLEKNTLCSDFFTERDGPWPVGHIY